MSLKRNRNSHLPFFFLLLFQHFPPSGLTYWSIKLFFLRLDDKIIFDFAAIVSSAKSSHSTRKKEAAEKLIVSNFVAVTWFEN